MNNLFKRLKFFVASPTHSRTLTILALLIVIAAIPMTVFIAQQQQEVRQRASSGCVAEGQDCGYPQNCDPGNGNSGDGEQRCDGTCDADLNCSVSCGGCSCIPGHDCSTPSGEEECNPDQGKNCPQTNPCQLSVCNNNKCVNRNIDQGQYAGCNGDKKCDGSGNCVGTTSCTYDGGGCNNSSQFCDNGQCTDCSSGNLNCDEVQGCETQGTSCSTGGSCAPQSCPYSTGVDGRLYECHAEDKSGGGCNFVEGCSWCDDKGPVGGITCSGGYNPGYDYPACQGCDEGTWTCGSDGNWDWDSVTNPSSNCGGSCGTSSSGCESLSSGQFNYECKSGGCPSGWTQSVNTDCPSGQTCCYDYDWTAPTPTSSPTACWQCKCTYDNYHEASAGVSSPEDCTDAACRSQLGSNWFRRSEAQPAQKNECIGNCTRDCIDGGGDGGPRATATLTPTLTPTVTVTLTPTVTPTTTTTPTNTPTPTSTGGTKLALDLILSFIGGSRGNTNPVSKEKNLTVCIYGANVDPSGDTNCSKGAKKEGKINFDSTSGNYKNSSFDIGSFTTGSYQVFVTTNKYLRKRIPTITSITSGQTNAVSSATLNIGDINSDNIINVGDYEAYRACYGNKTPTTDACKNADLNDDGKNDTQTDASDLRLLFEAFKNQTGD